jgi:hypothetical protein
MARYVTDRPEFLIGKKAEKAFSSFFDDFKFASPDHDINGHWDVEIDIGRKVKVDVKSIKKENRYDKFYNETFHWIEVKNVMGRKGWLYGDADMFAFELEDYWVMVEKQPLQNFIADKCKGKKIGTVKNIYDLYRRKDKKDVVVKIKSIDLMYLSCSIFKKINVCV